MQTFTTYKAAMEYVATREAAIGKMKFRSTQEYRELFPKLTALYKVEGLQAPKRHRVEISVCLHV